MLKQIGKAIDTKDKFVLMISGRMKISLFFFCVFFFFFFLFFCFFQHFEDNIFGNS